MNKNCNCFDLVFLKGSNVCIDKTDGYIIDWTCDGYTHCQAGLQIIINCTQTHQVFNPDNHMCDR